MMKSTPVTSAVLLFESIGTPFLGVDLVDREQRQAEVAQRAEQSVQRRLVDDGALDEGGAVGPGRERHPVEPGRPAGAEVALEPDLVPATVVPTAGRRVAHRSSSLPAGGFRDDGNVGADVVSGDHHIW